MTLFNRSLYQLPLSQIAISSIDLRRSEIWWREGLGFLPSAGTRLFRGKSISGVVQMANAAATTRWLVGQDEWLQIELWQYENPVPRLLPAGYAPNHVGFSRCGVWVKGFDAALKRLKKLGTLPLSDPIGSQGKRRVCVRDPDGIYVELFESDPLSDSATEGIYTCDAAFRSMTITTENLAKSVQFAEQGLGLQRAKNQLHSDEHEQLWGFEEVLCERETFVSQSMLLEYVYYEKPLVVKKNPHALLNDQGILNVAFGDKKSVKGIERMCTQARKAGAIPSDWMRTPLGGCVYMKDPQGVSFEFMWARPGIGHKLTGYVPIKHTHYSSADNIRIENSIWIDAAPNDVFEFLTDYQRVSALFSGSKFEIINNGLCHAEGVGSELEIKGKLFTITVQIIHRECNKEIRYRILSGGPFNNYIGEVLLKDSDKGTRVIYISRFRPKIMGLGFVTSLVLKNSFNKILGVLKADMER